MTGIEQGPHRRDYLCRADHHDFQQQTLTQTTMKEPVQQQQTQAQLQRHNQHDRKGSDATTGHETDRHENPLTRSAIHREKDATTDDKTTTQQPIEEPPPLDDTVEYPGSDAPQEDHNASTGTTAYPETPRQQKTLTSPSTAHCMERYRRYSTGNHNHLGI